MNTIKFSYESDEGTKVTYEINGHTDLTSLLEEFKYFVKAMGYHPPDGDLEFVDWDAETVDDLYAEGYRDGMDVAKREMENGTFNTDNYVGTGDGLDLNDSDLLDGIQARAYRCESAGSELRTLSSDDTDSGDDDEEAQITACKLCQYTHGATEECASCSFIYPPSDGPVSE